MFPSTLYSLDALAYAAWMLTARPWAWSSEDCSWASSQLRAGLLSFGVVGGGGDARIEVLQALQMETLLGMMGPREKGVGLRGDLVGDTTESRPPGRLFAR